MSPELSLRDLVESRGTHRGEAAARRMQEADIHRLLVMEGGRLHWIITTSDVSRAVAERKA